MSVKVIPDEISIWISGHHLIHRGLTKTKGRRSRNFPLFFSLTAWVGTSYLIFCPDPSFTWNFTRLAVFDKSISKSSEKALATHSSTLAWKIPWMEEPGRLQSMGSLRVGQNWATSLSLFTFMHWRRKWQATPVFLPGESQGWRIPVGCRLWGRTESDTTEAT